MSILPTPSENTFRLVTIGTGAAVMGSLVYRTKVVQNVATAAILFLSKGKSRKDGEGFTIMFTALMGGISYMHYSQNLSTCFENDSVNSAHWKFFAFGTAVTAVALRCIGGENVWMQAALSVAAGYQYTYLMHDWSRNVIARKDITPSRQCELTRDLDKKYLKDLLLTFRIHIIDAYGQRDDVSPDEISDWMRPSLMGHKWELLSKKTLHKLLEANKCTSELLNCTSNEPNIQRQILKRYPLSAAYLPTVSLHHHIADELLQNPSVWDLVFIHQKHDISDCELLQNRSIRDPVFIPRKYAISKRLAALSCEEVVKSGAADYVVEHLPEKTLTEVMLNGATAFSLQKILEGKIQIQDVCAWIRANVPNMNIDVLRQIKIDNTVDAKNGITFLNAIGEHPDVQCSDVYAVFRTMSVCRNDAFTASSKIVEILCRNQSVTPNILYKALTLTYSNPERQIQLLKCFPLHKPLTNDKEWLYPPLHPETARVVLEKEVLSVWELVACSQVIAVSDYRWERINPASLQELTDEHAFYSSPLEIAVCRLPHQHCLPLMQKFLFGRAQGELSFHLVQGKTHIYEKDASALLRKMYGSQDKFVLQMFIVAHFAGRHEYVLEMLDAYGSRDDVTAEDLGDFESNWRKTFWQNTKWNTEELSDTTIMKMRVGMEKGAKLLHLLQKHPHHQIALVEQDRSCIFKFDRLDFGLSYPKLHPQTVEFILQQPSPMEIAFCAGQNERAKQRLKDVHVSQIDFQTDLEGNIRFWQNSRVKVIFDAFDKTQKLEFLEHFRGNVWFEHFLRRALRQKLDIPDNFLITWANDDIKAAVTIIQSRPDLLTYLDDSTQIRVTSILTNLNPPFYDIEKSDWTEFHHLFHPHDLAHLEPSFFVGEDRNTLTWLAASIQKPRLPDLPRSVMQEITKKTAFYGHLLGLWASRQRLTLEYFSSLDLVPNFQVNFRESVLQPYMYLSRMLLSSRFLSTTTTMNKMHEILTPQNWYYDPFKNDNLESGSSLDILPDDALIHICKRLTLSQISSLSQTCSALFNRIYGPSCRGLWLPNGSIGALRRRNEIIEAMKKYEEVDPDSLVPKLLDATLDYKP